MHGMIAHRAAKRGAGAANRPYARNGAVVVAADAAKRIVVAARGRHDRPTVAIPVLGQGMGLSTKMFHPLSHRPDIP